MTLDLVLRGTAALALGAMMTTVAPAALMAATPADTLVIADAIDDIVSIDPAQAFEFSGIDMLNNLYDTLVELDPENPGALVPGLAESWSVSDDGLTHSFTMKKGVTFSSGNPVRAEDAAWSLQRVVLLNKTPSFILTQFGFTPENVMEKIRAEGDQVMITVDRPYAPSFIYNCLTSLVAAVLDKETVMQHDAGGDMGNAWLGANSAGTGAYTLRSYKPNEGYVLEARADHWRGAPKLARVFVRHVPEPATQRLLLEKGDVDIARKLSTVDIEGVSGNPDITVTDDVGGYIYYLGMNQKHPALSNAKVRDALRYLIDYQGMADSFLKGQMMVQQNFLPRGYLGSLNENPYSFDPDKARALLAEAGYPEGFEIAISVRNDQQRVEMAQAIQNTFGQAGITVEIKPGPGAEVLGDYRARLHDITLQAWGPDYPDPHTNASTFAMNPDNSDEAKLTGYLAWRTAYDPGELHSMAEAAVIERDADKRRAMYEDIQRTHRSDSAFICMFQSIDQTAMRSSVQGFYTGGSTDQATFWLATK